MSDSKNESPYANIDMKEYEKRMKENRDKYQNKEVGIFESLKKIFLWWLNIGASFMGIDKKNILSYDEHMASKQYSSRSARESFRESNHVETKGFDPEKWGEMARAAKAYNDMTDGRGDKCGKGQSK